MRTEMEILTPEEVFALATTFFDHESGTRGMAVAQVDGQSFSVPVASTEGGFIPGRVVSLFHASNRENPVDALEKILHPLGFNKRTVD